MIIIDRENSSDEALTLGAFREDSLAMLKDIPESAYGNRSSLDGSVEHEKADSIASLPQAVNKARHKQSSTSHIRHRTLKTRGKTASPAEKYNLTGKSLEQYNKIFPSNAPVKKKENIGKWPENVRDNSKSPTHSDQEAPKMLIRQSPANLKQNESLKKSS